ncbi:MAG TPA: S41 family peptidase [Fimbriimonadaceae bacterium]|nr:S41 family peptidase [Fimbriimonadaceae bacterium]
MILAPLAFAIALQGPKVDFANAWSRIRSAIETRYYARTQQHDRMESLLNRYESDAKAATNQADFEKSVNQMIADFGDSHFGFFTKSDQGFYMMESLVKREGGTEMPNIGAWFRPEGNGYAIQMLLNGGTAEKAGLRKGDIVTRIDGDPFSPVDSLARFVGKAAKIDYVRNHVPMSADVEVGEATGHDFFLNGTRASIKTIDFQGKKYGYIHLWTMSDEEEKSTLANAVYGKLKNTAGFILDIRDGFGGRPEGFGDPFFRPDVHLSWEAQGFTNDELFGYGRPLVVLIDKGSRSAKEVFAYIMKTSKRATLVGEKTGGNVLGTSPSPVGDWGYLEIPMVDVKANGVRLEKVGVAPDIAVPQEFDANGHDLYIEEALKVLSKK